LAGFIDFIQCGEAGPIKLGPSRFDVEQRINAMQVDAAITKGVK
jgi:hypothetical protein